MNTAPRNSDSATNSGGPLRAMLRHPFLTFLGLLIVLPMLIGSFLPLLQNHTIAYKLPAIAFICGGIIAILAGTYLYYKGVGIAPDGSTVDAERGSLKVRVALKSVGSVLMATSIAWAYVGYLAFSKAKAELVEFKLYEALGLNENPGTRLKSASSGLATSSESQIGTSRTRTFTIGGGSTQEISVTHGDDDSPGIEDIDGALRQSLYLASFGEPTEIIVIRKKGGVTTTWTPDDGEIYERLKSFLDRSGDITK